MKPYKVKVHSVVTGQTFGAHQVLLEKVKNITWTIVEETRDLQESHVVIVFCPITSRVGSDLAAAMTGRSGKTCFNLFWVKSVQLRHYVHIRFCRTFRTRVHVQSEASFSRDELHRGGEEWKEWAMDLVCNRDGHSAVHSSTKLQLTVQQHIWWAFSTPTQGNGEARSIDQ